MSQSIDPAESLSKAIGIFKKLHYVIFSIVITIIVGLAITTVGSLLNMPNDYAFEQSLTAKRIVEDFDKDTTIPRVNELNFSDQSSAVKLPTNQRTNPFTE